jgi:type III secretion protein Q
MAPTDLPPSSSPPVMNLVPPRVDTNLGAALAALSPSAAQGSRLFHDRRLAALWRALGDRANSCWQPAAGPGGARRYELTLESETGSVAVALASDDEAIAAVAAANAGTPLQSLALDVLFERPLERLAALGLPGARVTRLAPATEPGTDACWSVLRRDDRELCRVAVRALPAPVHEALLGMRAPAERPRSRALRVAAAIALGERRLPIAVLRSLEPGDVVLLGLPCSAASLDGALATLRVGGGTCRLHARGRIDSTSFTILGDPFMTDHDPVRTPGCDLQAPALDALEVPVHFELETVSIAIADLESIEPGYVIELGTPASQARLRLVSCGVVIGEADLVAVAGQLGARITNLAAHHDADQLRG